jgi:hypothetical protein
MNKRDDALKLQAYVDGQLTRHEAEAMATLLTRDDQQRALRDELQSIKAWVRDSQVERPVPETREFYWSRIHRSIAAGSAERARGVGVGTLAWWLRWLVPASAAALLCVYWLVPMDRGTGSEEGLLVGHEIETPLAETTSFAFRSESAGMTVVWVETRALHNLVSGE